MTKVIVAVQRSPPDERAIDAELADSFPASDPPSWTTGIAETRPRGKPRVDPQVAHIEESTGAAGWLQPFISLAGVIVLVWAIPLYVVALPLALLWRAIVATTKWRAA